MMFIIKCCQKRGLMNNEWGQALGRKCVCVFNRFCGHSELWELSYLMFSWSISLCSFCLLSDPHDLVSTSSTSQHTSSIIIIIIIIFVLFNSSFTLIVMLLVSVAVLMISCLFLFDRNLGCHQVRTPLATWTRWRTLHTELDILSAVM